MLQPTLLIDEADTFLRDNEDLRGVLNSGHRHGGSVLRRNKLGLFWIEGSTRRWDGYNYFPEHPEPVIEWFDAHMG
jgi:hypothetical protein